MVWDTCHKRILKQFWQLFRYLRVCWNYFWKYENDRKIKIRISWIFWSLESSRGYLAGITWRKQLIWRKKQTLSKLNEEKCSINWWKYKRSIKEIDRAKIAHAENNPSLFREKEICFKVSHWINAHNITRNS